MSKRCASAGVEAHDTSQNSQSCLHFQTRAATKTRTPGTKVTSVGVRDALEPLDTFRAATFSPAVGLIGYIFLDRLDSQFTAKGVRSATTQPTKLDWMRMMRLAKFLVAHDEIEWLNHAQDVPKKYAVYGDSDWAGSETRRCTTGAFEQLGQHPIEFSCSTQHVVALSSGEAGCMPQVVQQLEGCSQCSC